MQRLSALLCAALSALTLTPALAAAPKAALVEQTFPSRPYNGAVNGSANYVTVGPGAAGTLGVTSMTLTNLGATDRNIFVFAPVLADGQTCTNNSTNVIGGGYPRFYVRVPANQTVHLTYPSPLVYPGNGGQSCVAFGSAAGVDIMVNGFLN